MKTHGKRKSSENLTRNFQFSPFARAHCAMHVLLCLFYCLVYDQVGVTRSGFVSQNQCIVIVLLPSSSSFSLHLHRLALNNGMKSFNARAISLLCFAVLFNGRKCCLLFCMQNSICEMLNKPKIR